jgi:methylenetetrahydrofolate--tRNA-(uracil-5-)-methyltransferase
MAMRGEQTLAFGPMKPVGLKDPSTGKIPHAVIQLRQDNRHASSYNIVGFQTKLTYPEQKRIFRTIPGLENAEFERLGSVHRNTFINAPRCLNAQLQLIAQPRIYFAGQITGVEGYVESAACGFMAGLFASSQLLQLPLLAPPATTACGALLHHLSNTPEHGTSFQPQNVNYGLFPPLEGKKMKRALRRLAMAERALAAFDDWLAHINPAPTTAIASGAPSEPAHE